MNLWKQMKYIPNSTTRFPELKDKISEFQGTSDALNSTLEQLKSAGEKDRSDLDRLNDAVNEIKSSAGGAKDQDSQQSQGLLDVTEDRGG